MNPKFFDRNKRVIDEFREHHGTVTTANFGRRLVLLHHVGAKSGQSMVTPVMHVRKGADIWYVAASKGGAPSNPSWFYNLLAHPDIDIETPDDGTVPVHVTQLHGAQRDTAYAQFKAMSPRFIQYELNTTRTIPVLQLTRRT